MPKDKIYKICNSINCFYANENLDFDEHETTNSVYECRFCAYDFNNLRKRRQFLSDEIKRFAKNPMRTVKNKACEILIKTFAILTGVVILIYFFNYLKFFSK